jgi:hypothetical protein
VLLRIVRTGNHRLWLWFGLVAGLGLETKHSMLMFGFALVAGLLLTRERTHLFNRWLLFGGAAAFLLFLPNLLWNIQHHFPFFEIQANIRRAGRDVSLSLPAFLGQETLAMLPTSLPLWAAGLWQLARSRFRALAFAWLFTAAIVFALSPRVYYLFPAFPMLFAAGAVQWEAWLSGPRTRWIRAAWVALTLAAGALIAPTMIPLLPPETYIRYAKAIHLDQPRIENHRLGPLPQLFADQFGWEEMTATVADAYRSLPPAIRARTAIFAQNYGQAGAIDLFGPRYGLPSAISGHQNYYLWGTHGATGDSLIVMGDSQEALERIFLSVRKMAHASHPYSMPYQHIDIFYCTGPRIPLAGLWPQIKAWH